MEHQVLCSTDAADIARTARAWGADVPFERPSSLAADASDSIAVALHALDWLAQRSLEPDVVLLVQPSTPLVEAGDLAGALRLHLETGEPVATVSAAPQAAWSYRLVEGRLTPLATVAATLLHDPAPVVSPNGAAYIATPTQIHQQRWLVSEGLTHPFEMPAERGVDVATAADLTTCEALLGLRLIAPVALHGRLIGPGHPCFVIAEAGVNHNGEIGLAHRLVDAAADAGADAVKFQAFDPERLAARGAPRAEYQRQPGDDSDQAELLRRLALPAAAFAALQEHARARGLLFLASAFDEQSADLLDQLDVAAFKVPSGEVTNHGLLAHIARFGRPLLMSTGMCDMLEVAQAIDVFRDAGDPPLALFHCVSSYPAPAARSNLLAMRTLSAGFGVPAGWSDHTLGWEISVAAVALGACLLEKHLTLSRGLSGPDHAASLEAQEFAALVSATRRAQAALGDGEKRPVPEELPIAAVARKSLHWRQSRSRASLVGAEDVVALRPGTGLAPSRIREVVGRRLASDVAAGRAVTLEDLEP